MRKSVYRITVSTGISRYIDGDLFGRDEFRLYANTDAGIRKHINGLIRDYTSDEIKHELVTLNKGNSPAENLFRPGFTAVLGVLPYEEIERHRLMSYYHSPTFGYVWLRCFIRVEYNPSRFTHK